MTSLDEFRGERAEQAARVLDVVMAALVRPRGVKLPGGTLEAYGELIEAFTEASLISESGNARRPSETIEWLAPSDAGELVGVGARRVCQLAAAGLVRHRKVGKHGHGYLIDAADLQRYFRGRGGK